MYIPMEPLRMTAMYCWTMEVGKSAMTQVSPSKRDRRTVFLIVLIILVWELIFFLTRHLNISLYSSHLPPFACRVSCVDCLESDGQVQDKDQP